MNGCKFWDAKPKMYSDAKNNAKLHGGASEDAPSRAPPKLSSSLFVSLSRAAPPLLFCATPSLLYIHFSSLILDFVTHILRYLLPLFAAPSVLELSSSLLLLVFLATPSFLSPSSSLSLSSLPP
ncbi:hypothetical protein BZA77DRAFT_350547 [Pyronema omphalodes]|nr:hypothetical protein BZA77DRAFT_350547 [Pyronema omphalodes]